MSKEMSHGRLEYASGVVAVHIIETVVNEYIDTAWEDYPDIGEKHWEYIKGRVAEKLLELQEDYLEDAEESEEDSYDSIYAEFSEAAKDVEP